MGKEIVLRFTNKTFKAFKEGMTTNPSLEQLAYLLCERYETTGGIIFIVKMILFPGPGDLEEQSNVIVTPSKNFQALAYYIAKMKEMCILDVHTHVHSGKASFSGTDMHFGRKNAEYICREVETLPLMMVCGNDINGQTSLIFDGNEFKEISRIEILGRGCDIRTEKSYGSCRYISESYLRQEIIPHWSQKTIEEQRIFIAGVGGNGSAIFENLVTMGAGTKTYGGWIAIADHDAIEYSNLNRIRYAYDEHIGVKKVFVAKEYAQQKNKNVKVITFPCKITENICEYRARNATVLIGAGDNDGVRKVLNNWSVKYGIPYIDSGCEIRINADKFTFESGGQVRIVLPGENGCLVCYRGYNPSQAAIDLMDENEKRIHASAGYVIGADVEATPAIVNLNSTISDIGTNAFLSIVHGQRFGSWDYAYFDQIKGTVITGKTEQNPDCPLCNP